MNSSSRAEIRRCRPLLGTFVEIRASGLEEPELQAAVNGAFSVVERFHQRLSVHEPASELSRLNREAFARPFRVGRETLAILRRAQKLARESQGAFDPTVAPLLARWGFLPPTLRREPGGSWRDLVLLPESNVRFRRPLALDLGGIAKGFAVDAAIKSLKHSGVQSAVVNAGGDLRVFGSQPSTVCLRHPRHPQSFAQTIEVRDAALATSSPCFTEKRWRAERVSHLVDPLSRRAITGAVSVSVCACECWLADALTKVVINAPERAGDLLGRYRAEAFVLTA